MTSFYGMGKRCQDESKCSATKLSSCSRMVKCFSSLRCLATVAVIFVVLAGPSKAMPGASSGSRMARRSEEPQSTLIAFPRVGRSVSDQEYFMSGDETAPEEHDALSLKASPEIKFGKRTRLHTRASKGSMMAFPRVGRSSPTYPKILPLLEHHFAKSASREWSDDQGSKIRSKRQALIPFPRTGKRSPTVIIPFHPTFGKRDSALIPYPRTGKRVFAPRTGKRSPAVWKRVFAPRTGKRAAFGPRTGKRAAFGPRTGKRASMHPYIGNGEVPEDVERHFLDGFGTSFDVNQINASELLQNLQDYKNQHSFESASDEENSNRDLDAEERSSDLRNALIDLDPEELGLKDAVRNNDLYQFLHSMLREIAKTQHQNGLTGYNEY